MKTHKFIPPIIKVFNCPINRKWRQTLSEQIRKLVKDKSKAWKKYISTKSISSLDKFKQIRKSL